MPIEILGRSRAATVQFFVKLLNGCAAKAPFLPFRLGSAVVRPVQVINFAHHQ